MKKDTSYLRDRQEIRVSLECILLSVKILTNSIGGEV
jgi:hypothetical protein